jgi:hypothetical protein
MVTKGYQKGVYDWVTKGIRGSSGGPIGHSGLALGVYGCESMARMLASTSSLSTKPA